MHYSFSKAIVMNVTTYDTLNDKGEPLIFLLKTIFAEFLTYTAAELVVEIEKMNGRSLRSVLDDKSVKKMFELLLKGEVRFVEIRDSYKMDEDPFGDEDEIKHYPPDFSLAIMCNHAVDYAPEAQRKFIFPNGLSLALNDRLFQGSIPLNIQDTFVGIFRRTLQSIGGVMGYVTYETSSAFVGGGSAFENYHRINTSLKPGYLDFIGGYFWLNYLNDNHIARLGGPEFVRSHAPCEVVEPPGSGLLLRLTENINHYSDDSLRDLRAFLAPLFPPDTGKNEPLKFEEGYLLRLVE
ncbi:hypothetical protein ACFPVX_10345 [Cohnella faecalis]|uniref:Uncharacterized protein n=1 Tax=Cohnella faecalis TaxID=2315694 RepID=A0A398CS41_9BACL|nr:hypothetical protein [Cohnella faecalis]RIE03558.1 hypothetical protein D3H35_11000 [Cohnella faecalis]